MSFNLFKKTKFLIGFLLVSATLVYSFTNFSQSNKSSLSVSPGQILLTTSVPDKKDVNALKEVGIELWKEFNIKMNTNNKNYFLYSAIVEFTSEQEGNNGDLVLFETFGECFISSLCFNQDSFFYAEKELNYKLRFDNRMNNYLDDKNIYFSMTGRNVQKLETPATLAAFEEFDKERRETYSDNTPVSLFRAELYDPNHVDNNSRLYWQIGLLSHDATQPVDFNSYLNSDEFKANVAYNTTNADPTTASWLNHLKNNEKQID